MSKFRSDTNSHSTLLLYIDCDSPKRQNTRHLSRCKWFFNVRQSSVSFTETHSFDTGCMFCIGPDLSLQVPSQSFWGNVKRCHCKKRHVEVLSCIPIQQIFSVHLSCNMYTVKAKTSNIPGTNITKRWWSFIPSGHVLPLKKLCSFHQQSVNSCETQHNHN